ncbi:hypothetical protein WSK_2153 [Novosphingobium sp. Rr 2-17]|uniref:hypothetical protein n=1 Tax=Novosphingobium sp. Rr 2-17 TaxID=555793 RepID=UPI00026991DF|nr:hypothetical protein [Novosphingobium sp. Rr 2-17]EIZ79307.1 hypothetical protein WSK_2153 [Novosphingobium sp. Rr 2-17]
MLHSASLSSAIGAPKAERPNVLLRAQDKVSWKRRTALLPVLFSILIALGVVLELRGMDMGKVLAMVPRDAAFWVVFAISYLAGPASEWIIYRRLWQLPVEGFAALLRKLVCNELLLGYLGEAYFYTWARQRSAMTAAPFGAIKDVSILSAMTGNAVTLILLLALWPMLSSTTIGFENRAVLLSLSVVLATSIVAMAFRRRIFSLSRDTLYFITGMHLARIVVATLLSAVLWHMVLPTVPVSWWLLLATLRLLISRLPFIPNKDVVFAGVAVLTLGHETNIAALMTMMASAILLVHLLLGLALVVNDLLRRAVRA